MYGVGTIRVIHIFKSPDVLEVIASQMFWFQIFAEGRAESKGVILTLNQRPNIYCDLGKTLNCLRYRNELRLINTQMVEYTWFSS